MILKTSNPETNFLNIQQLISHHYQNILIFNFCSICCVQNGQTFLTSNCSSTCTCNATEVTCVPAGCTDGRECRANRNGDLACLPLSKCTVALSLKQNSLSK